MSLADPDNVLRDQGCCHKQECANGHGATVRQNMDPMETSTLNSPYVFGASVIGPLHVERGLPCQDACSFAVLEGGLGVIAVADGLGSAAKSDRGAGTAVEVAIEAVRTVAGERPIEKIDLGDTAQQAVAQARGRLEDLARREEHGLKDLACTLVIVIFRGDTVGVAQVGDGAVVAGTADGPKLISGPGDSEFINEVVPLTSRIWKEAVRLCPETSGVTAVAAFTDGCMRGCLPKTPQGRVPFEGFFNPLFSYAGELTDLRKGEEDIAKFLSGEKLCETSEDDKTLVIAVLAQAGSSSGKPDCL